MGYGGLRRASIAPPLAARRIYFQRGESRRKATDPDSVARIGASQGKAGSVYSPLPATSAPAYGGILNLKILQRDLLGTSNVVFAIVIRRRRLRNVAPIHPPPRGMRRSVRCLNSRASRKTGMARPNAFYRNQISSVPGPHQHGERDRICL
jgi:hypothetical protein